MNAFLLSIGDELASGLTVNTNSAWLAERLGGLGIQTLAHVTVGDDLEAIITAIHSACEHLENRIDPSDKNGLLLITGGLGPTEDDLTRQGLADALSQPLVEDPDAMLQVERFFKSIQRPMAASNRVQALRPQEATILENAAGTAPGLWVRKDNVDIYVMPGVPREMREMFTHSILPALEEVRGKEAVVQLVSKINTFGLGESNLGERIKDLMARRPEEAVTQGSSQSPERMMVGTTVHEGIVSVRIYATGPRAGAQAVTEHMRQVLYERLGTLIFSEGDEALESAVAGLLKRERRTVAVAESCTGGMIAAMLTNVAGSSTYFQRGWVTYANAAKQEELGVPAEILAAHGAVSEPVARAMAEGARRQAGADYALAVTGIAGPDGGSVDKPVGTVWIALASAEETQARRFIFPGNRHAVRLRAAQMALALLRWKLMGAAVPI